MNWINKIKMKLCKHDFEIIKKKCSSSQELLDDGRTTYLVASKCKKCGLKEVKLKRIF